MNVGRESRKSRCEGTRDASFRHEVYIITHPTGVLVLTSFHKSKSSLKVGPFCFRQVHECWSVCLQQARQFLGGHLAQAQALVVEGADYL